MYCDVFLLIFNKTGILGFYWTFVFLVKIDIYVASHNISLSLPRPAAVAGIRFSPPVCLSVHPRYTSETDAAKLSVQTFHDVDESLENPFSLGQKVKGQGHEYKNSAGVGLCTLVSSGF